jgi:hypothetical protein
VRIYSRGDSNVTGGAAVAAIQTKEIAIVNVARVIATVHISLCRCDVEHKTGRIRRVKRDWEIITDNLSKPVGVWTTSQRLIPTGERSGLQTHIASS